MGTGLLSTGRRRQGPPDRTSADPAFPRRDGVLRCGDVSLEALAHQYSTPLYVYNGDRILERFHAVRDAFAPIDLLIAYSVKANPNLAVLRLLGEAGAGADIVSGGELYRTLRAGIDPERVVFAGVGKTRDEMRYALEQGIMAFHVESAQELAALGEVARGVGVTAPVAVRVNPDVHSPTHEFTRTGHASAKFGVSPDEAVLLYAAIVEHPGLSPVGVDVHIGSQIREPGPFLAALDVVLGVADRVRRACGADLRYADLGGGFGIADGEAGALDIHALAEGVADRLEGRSLSLVLEPGRFLVGDAGALLARVLYVKRSGGKTFVITDAGMTELIRPSHYGGVHAISLVCDGDKGAVERVDIVGPVCEQGDFLARDRRLPVPPPGALICVRQAGAYGFTMASNYNSRPRPAEVLVHGGHATLARRREEYDDLVRGEHDD